MKKITLGTILNCLETSTEFSKAFICRLVYSSGEVLECENLDLFKRFVIGSGEYFLKVEDWSISTDARIICFFI